MSSLIGSLPAADAAELPPQDVSPVERSASVAAGQPPQASQRTVEALPAEAELPLELELSANELRYDGALGRVIAEGHVQAMVAGGRLLADRLEYDTRSRTLFVKGNIRLQRGQQYLQASQLRYNLLEGSGEAENIYGILDLDGNETDFDLNEAPSVPLPPAEPLACTPLLPPVPNWQPYNWALTAWGGKMIDANFGDAFFFKGRWRPEYLAGLGLNKRLLNGGPFSLELDVNAIGHSANPQPGGAYNQIAGFEPLLGQSFAEFTGGVGLRIWMRPWLNIFLVEGISFNTAASDYERTFRERYMQFLNYLAFEVEALVNPQWSLVGRLHHRSGSYGVYSGVREGS
ncbi:MAG: DUF3769 domain-containing protein, partial [Cyanobacteria bacterium K_DeepCast_35m_m2_023]|nr:DUF3769 domain-containing protein [Cyanobacteria bacterium K_DeepCast_35m_m2_023]